MPNLSLRWESDGFAAICLVILLLLLAPFLNYATSSSTAQGNVTTSVTIPITCNSSLTVDTTLVSDLTCNGTALQIYVDNITLDCNGHRLSGNGTWYGIVVNASHVTVRNCIGKGFRIALYLDPNDTLIDNFTAEDSEYGIVVEDSYDTIIRYSTLLNNSVAGILLNNSNATYIHNSTFDKNRIGLEIVGGTGNIVWYNKFLHSTGLQVAHVNATAGNHFNTTLSGIARGNNWSDVVSLKIYDSDGDGFGDSGPDYPYSASKGGFVLGAVEDWGPITTRPPPVPPPLPAPPACRENWSCTDWRPCTPEGQQTRVCIDVNYCAQKLANGTVAQIIRSALPEQSRPCRYTPSCANSFKDVSESDVDCGGPCPPCELGKACAGNSDCASGFCDNGICAMIEVLPPIEVPLPVPTPSYYIIFTIAMSATALWVVLNFIAPHISKPHKRRFRKKQ